MVGIDEGADFVAVERLGPFIDVFQLFDLGAQEVAEVAAQDFTEHGFDGQELRLPRLTVENRRKVGGFVGGDAFGEYILPLQTRFLADVVGLADGIQRFGIVGGFGQFQKFENFILWHSNSIGLPGMG